MLVLWSPALASIVGLLACGPPQETTPEQYRQARETMVSQQIERRGITDPRVLQAMRSVPRHLFVPSEHRDAAYGDHPLPIGHGQTISQPYIVAFMTAAASLEPEDVVLEVGTGSGYQAAVLAEIVERVYTIEIVEPLAREARGRLEKLGYTNVETKIGDGYAGWAEHAPFDAILVTAAPDHIPEPLVEQLAPGGIMVIPVGSEYGVQSLTLVEKSPDGETTTESLLPVRFVPLVREPPR